MQFTKDQEKVLNARKCSLLVSAGAGSGKTAVLVERVIRLITEGNRPYNADEILVVTFTRAAAAEIRSRIATAITDRLEKDPGNEHLMQQSILIQRAQITTMDSFFNTVVRDHFMDIGISPDFRIMDEAEEKIMRRDALSDFIEKKYREKDPEFVYLSDYISGGTASPAGIDKILDALYTAALSHPFPQAWLENRAKDYDVPEDGLYASGWMHSMVKDGLLEFSEIMDRYGRIENECSKSGFAKYERLFRNEASQLVYEVLGETAEGVNTASEIVLKWCSDHKDLSPKETEALSKHFSALSLRSFVRAPSVKKTDAEYDRKDEFLDERAALKEGLKQIGEMFSGADERAVMDTAAHAGRAVRALCSFVSEFMSIYAEKKRKKKLADFTDVEHMALDILVGTEGGKIYAKDAALEYRNQFKEILIDEYQDTNEIQELILYAISGEPQGKPNRVMVGDVKQSIYSFRMAKPELFAAKSNTYKEDEGSFRKVVLNCNFRSRPEVLESVNHIFRMIMTREIGGIRYTEREYLKSPTEDKKNERYARYKTEFLIADCAPLTEQVPDQDVKKLNEAEPAEKEAVMIAEKIAGLVGKFDIPDENGRIRKARYSDIVILLRSIRHWDQVIPDVFSRCGIPYSIEQKTGYFDSREIKEFLQLLQVIDNPVQDIPLYGVMTGAFGNFSEEDAARIRIHADKDDDLYHALMKACAEADHPTENKITAPLADKCRSLMEWICSLRKAAPFLSVSELLDKILFESDFLEYVSALPGGEQRRLNVEMFLSQAAAFDRTSMSGLYSFVQYIEDMKKHGVDFGSGSALQNADVVRVMTIHKAKGLEFPICFVSGLSKQFAPERTMPAGLVMHPLDGIGIDYINIEEKTKNRTIRGRYIENKNRTDKIGEELRILYVAATRAKYKLILTASTKYADRYVFQEEGRGIPSPGEVKKCHSFLDFISLAAEAYSKSERPFEAQIHNCLSMSASGICRQIDMEEKKIRLSSVLESWTNTEEKEKLKRIWEYQYPYKPETTESLDNMQTDEEEYIPDFLTAEAE